MSGPSNPVSVATENSHAGVIHDIGYRHYDGTRQGRGYIVRSLFVQSLRGAYGLGRSAKSKVLPIALFAIMILPAAVLVAVMNILGSDAPLIPYARYAIVLQAIVSIYVAAQAPQLVSRDLRFRTMTLYFSRPLTQFDFVAAKFAAMTAALFILMAVPLTILYIGALLAKLSFGTQTKEYLLSLVGVLLFSLVLAGIGLLLAALTTRRGLGVASIIALLTISFGGTGMVQGVAQELGNERLAGWAGMFSPFTLVDGVQVWLLGAESSSVVGPPGTAGGVVFFLITLALIAASFGLLLVRYRKVVAA